MKKLGFGLMRLPLTDPSDSTKIDFDQMNEMVDAFLDNGFTYFDTAWMYHGEQSERAVKDALVSRHARDSFTLTTKLPGYLLHGPEDRDRIFQEQMRRTGAGYFDYYLLHDVNSGSIDTFEKYDCFSWAQQKKEEGLVRSVGFSFHDGPELLDKVLSEHPEVEFVQLQLNYLDWNSLGIRSRECYETACRHGKPVFVMEPVKGGTLASVPENVLRMFREADPDASPASWAIRFAAGLDNVALVLSGMSNMDQLRDNMSFMSDPKSLTEAEMDMVLRAGEMINGTISIPCTGCSYCTVDCPADIPIPDYFSLYNLDRQEIPSKGWTPQITYYGNLSKNRGKASDCLRCGNCESHCPQHLPIRDLLEKVASYFGSR